MSFYIKDLDKWISYYQWLILLNVVTVAMFAMAVALIIDGIFNGNLNQSFKRLTDLIAQALRKTGSYSELIDTAGFVAVFALSVYCLFQIK